MQRSILVIGGGNIGLATAALCCQQGHPTHLYSRRFSTITSKIITSKGLVASGKHQLASCSNNLDEIASQNDGHIPNQIVICCRGQDVEVYGQTIARFVNSFDNVLLICSSRFAGRVLIRSLKQSGVREEDLPAIADVNTSPFVSRTQGNKVEIYALKGRIEIAAQNIDLTQRVLAVFQPIFGNLYAIYNSLELNIRKLDDIVHIPLLLTAWYKLETGAPHNLYRHLGQRTANLIWELDQDRLKVAKVFGFDGVDVCSRYQHSYGTSGDSIHDHLQQVTAYEKAMVGNPYHRYLMEDLPFGAYPLKALALIANVLTPVLDSCITLGSKLVDIPSPWTQEFLELEKL